MPGFGGNTGISEHVGQFLGHARPAIAAQRDGELFTDMSQHNHVLAMAGLSSQIHCRSDEEAAAHDQDGLGL